MDDVSKTPNHDRVPSEAHELEYLFDAALDAVIGMDEDGKVIAWNRQAAESFGRSRSAAMGKLLSDLIIPARLREAHSNGLAEYLKTGTGPVLNRRIEVTAVNAEGVEFPVELSVIPIRNGTQSVFYGFLRDRSAQVYGEEQLAQARLRDQTMLEIALMASDPGDFEKVLQRSVELICEMTGWACGHIYLPDRPSRPRSLVSTPIWYFRSDEFASVEACSLASSLAYGEGLPGRIWATGEPVWIPDVSQSDGFLRREQFEAAGLRAGFGFPIKHGDNLLAVLEFFSEHAREPDEELLQTLKRIGSHLGRVFERERAQEQTRLLVRELSHRVGNLMAVVSSVFQRSVRHSKSIEDLQSKFLERLHALNIVQRQMTQTNWEAITVADLASGVLAPYTVSQRCCTYSGAEVYLEASRALSLSLVLHELAVNAVKYGALSAATGKLDVSWTVEDDGQDRELLHLDWKETGGPPAHEPASSGFGSELVQQVVERGMSGSFTPVYDSRGFSATIRIPL